jgi:hypothetical protein
MAEKIKRLKIVFEWLLFNTVLFVIFSYFMPGFIACNLALILTFGGFFSDRNKAQQEAMRRPVIEIYLKEV